MTVPQLKELLREKGLVIGGKKAELIIRLEENTVRAKTKSTKKSADAELLVGGLPFFLAIKEGNLGDVEIDRWKAASYGMAFFMFIMLIVGLNSMSWYSASSEESEDEFFTISKELSVGLSDLEMEMSALGFTEGMKASLSDCAEDKENNAELSCGTLSNAGTINTICIILSMVAIIILLTFSIGRGFGIFSTGVLDKKSELIEKISWLVAVISINLGTLSYGIIAGFLTDIEEPWDGGLGGMWWTMFLLSLIFAAVVYNERIKALISSVKNRN